MNPLSLTLNISNNEKIKFKKNNYLKKIPSNNLHNFENIYQELLLKNKSNPINLTKYNKILNNKTKIITHGPIDDQLPRSSLNSLFGLGIDFYINQEKTLFLKKYNILSEDLYGQELLYVTKEIFMQKKAYDLNDKCETYKNKKRKINNTINTCLVKIPKIYSYFRIGYDIYIIMDYISLTRIKLPIQNRKSSTSVSTNLNSNSYTVNKINQEEFYNKYNSIITKTFNYFQENGLYHNDSAHRNVYFHQDETDGELYVVIIDFGEATFRKGDYQRNGYKIEEQTSNWFFNSWLQKKFNHNMIERY